MLVDWRIAITATILAWGAQAVILKYLVTDASLQSVIFLIWALGSVAGLVYFVYVGHIPPITFKQAAWIAVMGVLAGIGYLGFMYSLSVAPATIVIPLSALNVAVAVLLSAAIFGEPLTSREIGGLLLALAATVVLATS